MAMSDLLVIGIIIGIPIGMILDRWVLQARALPWLISHGWR